jgi:transmembrane sensor
MSDRENHLEPADSESSRDWEAFARHLAGESSSEERAHMEAVLASRPQDRDLLLALDKAASLSSEIPTDIDVEGALARVKARPDFREKPRFEVHRGAPVSAPRRSARFRWAVAIPAIAAAALLAVAIPKWLATGKSVEPGVEPAQRMLATGVGVRDSLQLPDGSRVILGPLSSVTIAQGYGKTSRQVEIRGDAWFDVVHDSARPFTVKAGKAAIVDIGTKFAVRSDAPDGVAVTVTQGSVSLRQVNTPVQQGVILKAGDNGLLKAGGEVVTRRGAASDDDVAWLKGRLVFREAPLDEVKASMRRWYGLDIRFEDPSLANRHITATFNGESPDRVLDVLGLVLGAEVERRGDTAVVRSAKGSMRSR